MLTLLRITAILRRVYFLKGKKMKTFASLCCLALVLVTADTAEARCRVRRVCRPNCCPQVQNPATPIAPVPEPKLDPNRMPEPQPDYPAKSVPSKN